MDAIFQVEPGLQMKVWFLRIIIINNVYKFLTFLFFPLNILSDVVMVQFRLLFT